MPTADRSQYPPGVGGAPYYYPGEDFNAWRTRFVDLCGRQQWTDSVAKPIAFAYTRDLATMAVMDTPYHGPENLATFLDIYGIRFRLLGELMRLRPSREE